MRAEGAKERRKKEEGGLPLFPFSLLLLSLCLAACAKPKKPEGDKPKKEDKPIIGSVGIGAGNTTIYSTSDVKSPPSFTLKWTKGSFDAEKGGIGSGRLTEPSGTIFSGAKPSSTYRADEGEAIKAQKRLNMRGDVTLRSLDGTQTLKAPEAEYRGDVKLVRAMGGVVATGPFGTLSGVPELWATPDLRLIGTPDMVSKTLKIPALIALAATATVGSTQVQGKDYTLVAPGANSKFDVVNRRATVTPKPGSSAIVTIASRGLVATFTQTVILDFAPKTLDVVHMTTSGPVHLVQTSGEGVTTIDGKGVEYDWKLGAETASLDLDGPVKIVRAAKVKNAANQTVEQTTTTKGDKGRAILVNKPKADQDGLKNATLSGNVTIDVSEVDGQTFSGKGERMVYVPNGETASVEVTGRTTMTSVSRKADASRTVISQGDRGTAVLVAKPKPGGNPLKSATLVGNVEIDVSGSNEETFQGSGDRLVFTAEGEGGRAVMTGALKFSGNAAEFIGNVSGVDTAIMTIGKKGWETIETKNSGGKPTNTTIIPKDKPKKKGGTP